MPGIGEAISPYEARFSSHDNWELNAGGHQGVIRGLAASGGFTFVNGHPPRVKRNGVDLFLSDGLLAPNLKLRMSLRDPQETFIASVTKRQVSEYSGLTSIRMLRDSPRHQAVIDLEILRGCTNSLIRSFT